MFNNVIFTRLLYLTFDDLTFCAGQMLDHWTVNSVEGSSGKYLFKLIADQFCLLITPRSQWHGKEQKEVGRIQNKNNCHPNFF